MNHVSIERVSVPTSSYRLNVYDMKAHVVTKISPSIIVNDMAQTHHSQQYEISISQVHVWGASLGKMACPGWNYVMTEIVEIQLDEISFLNGVTIM